MTFIKKAFDMLFRKSHADRSEDPIQARVKTAVTRNEDAGEKARQALQEYQMSKTIRHLSGKMQ